MNFDNTLEGRRKRREEARKAARPTFADWLIATAVVLFMIVVVQGIAGGLLGACVYAVWNLVVAAVTPVPHIAYWQCVIVGVAISLFLGVLRTSGTPKNVGGNE